MIIAYLKLSAPMLSNINLCYTSMVPVDVSGYCTRTSFGIVFEPVIRSMS